MEKSSQDGNPRDRYYSSNAAGNSTCNCTSRRDRIIGRLFRRTLIVLCLGFVLYVFVSWPSINKGSFSSDSWLEHAFDENGDGDDEAGKLSTKNSKVPLDVHIMSKCPDARDCLQQLIVPAMERIDDVVDFKLSFIAR